MLTTTTRKQLKKKDIDLIISENYEMFSSASSTLRAIYVTLGWTHMTKDWNRALETIEELTKSTLESFKKNNKRTSCSTAGISVDVYFDEMTDKLNINVSFEII